MWLTHIYSANACQDFSALYSSFIYSAEAFYFSLFLFSHSHSSVFAPQGFNFGLWISLLEVMEDLRGRQSTLADFQRKVMTVTINTGHSICHRQRLQN